MQPKTVPELWRLRDQLASCVRHATIARRKNEDTYEIAIAMPRTWRSRGQQFVLLAGILPLEIASEIVKRKTLGVNVLWVRGDTKKALTRGWLRLHGIERALREHYRLSPDEWDAFKRERDTPCDRCKVRFYGGLVQWRQRTFRESKIDSLDSDYADLLDFEDAQEAHLKAHGFIKPRDYAVYQERNQ